jgi:predicted PurR-regulated permease PerM
MNGQHPILSPTATFWAILFAFATGMLLLFSAILPPFAAGFVIAYLFHPVVNILNRASLPRGAAAFFIVVVLSLIIAALFALIVPPLINQFSELIQSLPSLYERARNYITEHYGSYLQWVSPRQQSGAPGSLEQQITQNVTPWLMAQLQGLLKSGLDIFSTLALLFLTPVVAFFLLRDWNKMIASMREFFPRQNAPTVTMLAEEIDSTIAGYLRGTLIVLLIVSGFYMVTLGLIGLNYGLLIGLGAGLFSFVPYLGSTSGFLVSGGVALAQFWPDYTKAALVCGIFVFGQLVEGNVLTPNIVGNRVRLHPVWLLFALIASGYLLGFLGLLISVPLAAAIGVLVRYAIRRYYASPMHQGDQYLETQPRSSGL